MVNVKSKFKYYSVVFGLGVILLLAAPGCKIISGLSEGEVEQAVFQLINSHRLSVQLSQLAWNAAIAEQARIHSEDMASGKAGVGHDGHEERYDNIRAVLNDAVSFGEIVAYIAGYADPADSALESWLVNPDHKSVIGGDFDLTGVGVAKKGKKEYYITQIFIKTR